MNFDTVILGAGAAGMMCAARSGGRTLVLDHARAPGEKIRISGGGRCNFTNIHAGPENFLSGNPHFCKSALARYTQWDFIDLVARNGIAHHEKTLGQLFCDGSSRQIVDLLVRELGANGAELRTGVSIEGVRKSGQTFTVTTSQGEITCRNLVLATGGKSIPKMGATGLAYDIARQFGLRVTDTRPALVPFTFPEGRFKPLAGVSLPVRASAGTGSFDEAMLFTHRGLSGPAMLQISSYWREGQDICIDLSPSAPILERLREERSHHGRRGMAAALGAILPSRLAERIVEEKALQGNIADQSDTSLSALASDLHAWVLKPSGTEGYRTAEVTLGGIDTDDVDSRTMQAKAVPGLYAIGEAVDVTGWLGGYNFQWAWASGHAAGTAISQQ